MITWFQRVFGKHFKWVLLAFLVVLLFSFIVGIGAVPRLNVQGPRTQSQMFLGVDVDDREQMQDLANNIRFASLNLYQKQISSDQELNQLVTQRIVLMHLADEWHIPDPSPKQMEDYLRSARGFRDANDQFSNALYQKFKDWVEDHTTAEREHITAWLKEDCRLDRVSAILSGPGYVMPELAEYQVAVGQAKSDLEVGTLDYKKFEPKIELSGDKLTAALQDLFNKNPARFQRPGEANLSYVKFASAPVADPTPAQLHDYATQHKEMFPGVDPEKLSDKDKTALTDAWRAEQKQKALTDAADRTMTYARELYPLKAPPGSPAFDKLLQKYNVTLQTLPAITQGKAVPADSPIPNDDLQEIAFAPNNDRPFTPVRLTDGAAVVFIGQTTPARDSLFAEARDDVLKAYTDTEKARQFTDHCNTVHDAIVKAIASGKTFAEAAKAEGVDVKNYPAITYDDIQNTLMTMSFDPNDKSTPTGPLAAMGRDVLTILANPNSSGTPFLTMLHAGEVSPIQLQGDVGAIFYVNKRETAPVAADSPEVQHVQLALKEQEAELSSLFVINQLAQDAMKTLKPAGK